MSIKDTLAAAKEAHDKDKELKLREKYMQMAIKEAQKAAAIREVPIGCVIVREGKVIAKGYNRRNTDKSVLKHAEIDAIRDACKKVKDWRLEDCTLYVTLEPCPMCAGAIVQARIPTVVIGSMNPKAGCAGSVINLLDMAGFNHQCEVIRGVLGEETSSLLTNFFKDLRVEKVAQKEAEKADAAAEENEESKE
ncbi:MAG: nucleoside deaminase [Lachnospiraceae bacterium]|jgi:tRNA(adenine34) deaminase|nr:nucleoside deaminase [Lachnospiraceae bacterium]